MSILKTVEGPLKDGVLVLGLATTDSIGGLAIESGDIAVDSRALIASLTEMGATGAPDEVI